MEWATSLRVTGVRPELFRKQPPNFPLVVRPGRSPVEEDGHIHLKHLGDLLQHINVRTGVAGLVMGDGLAADVEPLCQLVLGDPAPDPCVPDIFTDVPHLRHLISGRIISPGGGVCHAQNLSIRQIHNFCGKTGGCREHPPVINNVSIRPLSRCTGRR